MSFRLLTLVAIVLSSAGLCWSAEIEMTGYGPGRNTMGVKIEGEIAPGDAAKLFRLYAYFGPLATANIFLWSRGGDVEEAIKIGKLVRKLVTVHTLVA